MARKRIVIKTMSYSSLNHIKVFKEFDGKSVILNICSESGYRYALQN